jgi:copper(I)-binding protein
MDVRLNINIMKKIIALCFVVVLAGCFPQANTVVVSDAYMFATPKKFPAAAIFMTISNNTKVDDRVIGFKTDRAGRAELHTMETKNDIMKMRHVDGYDIAAGHTHTLKPMADHIMVFDMVSDFVTGEMVDAIVSFEKAGEVAVTIRVKSRADMMKHH